jgi:hypothetical protein
LGIGFGYLLFASGLFVATNGTVLAGSGIGLSVVLFTGILPNLAPQSLRGGLVSIGESVNCVIQTLTPVAIGIIGAAQSDLGTALAIQVAGLGVAGVGAGGSVACLLVAVALPKTKAEEGITAAG